MFKTVNQSFSNQICIVANADVYFDESIVKLNYVDYANRIIALSSYDNKTKLLEDKSFDSWVLKSINLPYSEYEIGKAHDELRLLSILRKNEIDVINPSKEIFSYHIDSFKSLKYLTSDNLEYIEPSTLIDKPTVRQSIKAVEPLLISPTEEYSITPKIRIAVHLHLYYHDLWDEFSSMFEYLKKYDYDIYITLSNGSATIGQTKWIKDKIKSDYPGAIIIDADNKGLDIGAFLVFIEHILKCNKSYNYVLKLHTKKSVNSAGADFGLNWRRQLYTPLVSTQKIVDSVIDKFSTNDKIGMIGNISWISDYEGSNRKNIDELKTILNIRTKHRRFIGGTMFWITFPIIKKYFNQSNISKIYNLLESNYFTDYDSGTYTHAMERILGYIVYDSNKIITGI